MRYQEWRKPAGGDLRRRALFGLGAGALALGLVGAAGSGAAHAQGRIIQMGSASLGSTGYVIIDTLSAVVNKYSDPKLRTSSMSTSGGAENMALIGQGLIDFGQTTSADWLPAMKGMKPYPEPIEVHQMFAYMVWTPVPFVRKDSDIRTIHDLAGRRFSTGSAGGSATRLWRTILGEAGFLDKVDLTFTGGWRAAYDAFKQRAIDSTTAILTVGKPSPIVQELESTVDVRAIEVPAEWIRGAQKVNPGVLTFELTPGHWPAVTKPMTVPSYAGILAAHPRVTEEEGYIVTKAVYENAATVRKMNKLMQNIRPDFAVKYLMEGVPVQPGAARYFKEKGLWREELTIASK